MDIYEKTKNFYESFAGEKTVVGKSVLGRDIYAVKIGDGSPTGIAQYAIHGREFITAELAFVQAKTALAKGSFWLIPLTNPDGALLSEVGLDSVEKDGDKRRLLSLNNGGRDFSLWKANARGVDLNVNFPAKWGRGEKNTRFAGAENYVGKKPFSEPETRSLKRFSEKICPDYTISYHTKGEEIYWYFYQTERNAARDKKLALALSLATGYPLAEAKGSAGGYKDWCIRRLKIPAFTIEAGSDFLRHPIREEGLENILRKNKNALYALSDAFETDGKNG